DQFEDISRSQTSLDDLWDNLAPVINYRKAPANIVIGIREDYLALLSGLMDRVPRLLENHYRLEHLTIDEAREAINSPIDHYNKTYSKAGHTIRIEPGLVDTVIEQVCHSELSIHMLKDSHDIIRTSIMPGRNPIECPFLQLVMARIWREEQDNNSYTLTLHKNCRLPAGRNRIQYVQQASFDPMVRADGECKCSLRSG
ncbi:MAG: nSTAND1 domain-containing NTPase, partial [Planctomycetota bacterium]